MAQLRAFGVAGESPPTPAVALEPQPGPVADEAADVAVVPLVAVPMRVRAPVAAERLGIDGFERVQDRWDGRKRFAARVARRPTFRPVRRQRRRNETYGRRAQGPGTDQFRQQ